MAAALLAELPADQAIVGARPPRAGSSHRWGVAVSGAAGRGCGLGLADGRAMQLCSQLACKAIVGLCRGRLRPAECDS